MQKKKIGNSEELYGELGEAFNFTQGDLEANRAGFISHRQQAIQAKETGGIIQGSYLLISFFVLLGFLPVYFAISSTGLNIQTVVASLIALIMAGIIISGIIQYIRYMRKVHNAEMRSKRVAEIICQKSTGLFEHGRNQEPILLGFTEDKDRRVFPISEENYQLLPNKSYRVYYLPASREILSLELNQPEQE